MRGLVTAGPCVRLERCAGLSTSVAKIGSRAWLLNSLGGALLLALRVLDCWTPTVSSGGGGSVVGQHRQRPAPAGQFAGDGDVGDHRPFLAQVQVDPAGVQALVAGMRARAGRGRCLVPAALQHHAGSTVGGAVVPGGLDQQPAHVRVAGLGDRPLRPALPGGMLAGHQAEVGADAGAGEPVPVTDLDRQREPGQRRDAPQTRQPVHHRG